MSVRKSVRVCHVSVRHIKFNCLSAIMSWISKDLLFSERVFSNTKVAVRLLNTVAVRVMLLLTQARGHRLKARDDFCFDDVATVTHGTEQLGQPRMYPGRLHKLVPDSPQTRTDFMTY